MGFKWQNFAFQQFARAHVLFFRLSRGRVGGTFRGAPVLLLNHVGRKSGDWRTTPLLYLADRNNYVVVGSKAGSHKHPAWFLNLREMDETTIEVGGETIPVTVKVASPAQRKRLFPLLVDMYAEYERYQERTQREIPFVILSPIAD